MDFRLVAIAAFVGFFGDAALQLIVGNTGYDWGLREYFALHGSAEALFIAAGMLAIFFAALGLIPGFPINYLSLAIVGALLDILFRAGNIFPSLAGYYQSLDPITSIVWGAIPMMLPLFFLRMAFH